MAKSTGIAAPGMTSRNKVSAAFDLVVNILAYSAGILVIFLMFLIGADVISRKLAGFNISWATEITENAVLYVAFAAAAWLLKQNRHVNVDIVITHLNKRSQIIMQTATSVVGAALCFFMTYRAFLVTLDVWRRGAATVSVMEIPLTPLMAIVTAGLFLLAIQFVRNAGLHIRKFKETRKPALK